MLSKLRENVQTIVILAAFATTILGFKACFVSASSFHQLAIRVDQKILADRMDNVQERMWKLEDRYGGRNVPDADSVILGEYRELQVEREKLLRALEGLNDE